MNFKYDWNSIRDEFIRGDTTPAALAKKYNISLSALYRHYKSENWGKLRNEYKESTASVSEDITQEKLKKEIVIADKLTEVLDEAINDEKQFYRYIVKEKNGADSGEEERIFGKMDMQAFNNAIKALDSLQEIKRVMHGILTPAEERKMKLAEEKTEGGDTETKESGVVILPEIKEDK